jgi:hypothetical protein
MNVGAHEAPTCPSRVSSITVDENPDPSRFVVGLFQAAAAGVTRLAHGPQIGHSSHALLLRRG